MAATMAPTFGQWQKSSRSDNLSITNCVEATRVLEGGGAFRDSKQGGNGAVLLFGDDAMSAFFDDAKEGLFDL